MPRAVHAAVAGDRELVVLTNLPKRAIEVHSSTKAAAFARRYMPAIPPFLLMESSYVLRTWNRSVSLIQTSPVQFEKEDSTTRRSHLLLSPCGAQLVRETEVCHNSGMSPPRAAALRSRPDQPPMIMSVDQCLENVSTGYTTAQTHLIGILLPPNLRSTFSNLCPAGTRFRRILAQRDRTPLPCSSPPPWQNKDTERRKRENALSSFRGFLERSSTRPHTSPFSSRESRPHHPGPMLYKRF